MFVQQVSPFALNVNALKAITEVTMSLWNGDLFLNCNDQFIHLTEGFKDDLQDYGAISALVVDWGYEKRLDTSMLIYKRSLPRGAVIEIHEPDAIQI